MRSFFISLIVIVILILLQYIQLLAESEYYPNKVMTINNFLLKKQSVGCWYAASGLLLQLAACEVLPVGTELSLVGTVRVSTDSDGEQLNLLDVSQSMVTFDPSLSPWYHPKTIRSRLFQARTVLFDQLAVVLPLEEASIFFSIVFGGVTDIPEGIERGIASLGVQYLLAASGMQVALVFLTISPLLRRLPQATSWMLELLIMGIYANLALLSTSVLRASWQRLHRDTARLLLFQYSSSWSVAVFAIVATVVGGIDRAIALQLTLGAILGLQFRQLLPAIRLTSPRKKSALTKIFFNCMQYSSEIVITSIAIQLWLFPLLSVHFDGVQVLSLVGSVALVWLLEPVFVIGLPTMVALIGGAMLHVPMLLLLILSYPLHACLQLVAALLRAAAAISLPPIQLHFSLGGLVGWYAALLFCLVILRLLRLRRRSFSIQPYLLYQK